MKYCWIFAFLLFGLATQAQQPTNLKSPSEANLILLGKHAEGKNILRWAPRNYALWQSANEGGYLLHRYELKRGGIVWESEKQLTAQPLKPLSIEEWKANFEEENQLAAVAVQSLYGGTLEDENSPEGAFGDVVSQYMQQENLFGFGMLVADASAEVAASMALRFEDTEIEEGKMYVYRLALSNPKRRFAN